MSKGVLIEPTAVCNGCYARSILAVMAVEFFKHCVSSEQVNEFKNEEMQMLCFRLFGALDAYYSLGIFPDDVYINFSLLIKTCSDAPSSDSLFDLCQYVSKLDVRILDG